MKQTHPWFNAILRVILFVFPMLFCSAGSIADIPPKATRYDIYFKFQQREFKALSTTLEALQDACEEEYKAEDLLFDAFEIFRKINFVYDSAFTDWIRVVPDSYAPLIARAEYLCARAQQARGNKRTLTKGQKEYREMERLYTLALQDIEEALKRNARLDVCYAMQIEIGTALDMQEMVLNAAAEASKYHPYGYRIKWAYVQTLTPRKGGSYQKMEGLIRSYESMAAQNPKIKELSASIPAEKGSTFAFLGKYDQAAMMFTEALMHSKHHSIYADRGDAYARAGKYKLAFADYDTALKLSPKDPEYLLRKEYAADLQSRPVQAAQSNSDDGEIEDWPPKRMNAGDTKKASEYAKKGSELLRAESFHEAAVQFTEAIRYAPNDFGLYYTRGISYMYASNEDAALQDFLKTVQLKKDHIAAYLRLTAIYSNRGLYDDAVNAINSAMAYKPNDAELLYNRGKVNERRGMTVEALEDIRRACEMGYQRACREYKINK